MVIRIHPHSRARMQERGASEDEVIETIETGEKFPAKFGRIGFRRNFNFEGMWRGRKYNTKQVEVCAVKENDDFVVITVIVKYF
jgi:hypothetical protein